MKTNDDKSRFLEELQKTPVVQIACQKTNIGRTTYYRFRREDKKFAALADEALNEGRRVVNDLGEAQMISLIKAQDMQAIRFWLTHNNSRYGNKLEIMGSLTHTSDLTPEQQKLLKQALKLALPKESHEETRPKDTGSNAVDDKKPKL